MRIAEFSDVLSPILVKELRQGRRSRALVLLAVLTFVAAGLISLLFVIGGKGRPNEGLFSGLYGCLSLIGFLIFPLMAHRSLVREQEAGSWEILQLTGLGPRRIIAGKLMSSLAEMGILSLAVAPFLLLCHFRDQMDLLTIALLCLAGAVMTDALTVVALFAATLPRTRSQRSVIQIVLMLGLVLGMSGSMAIANDVGRRGVELGPMLVSFGAIFAVSYLLFETAAARLSLVAEDYAWRPRVALLVLLAGECAYKLWRPFEQDGALSDVVAIAIIACGALGMATEADRAGPPRGRRWPLSLFAPGALSGFRLTVALLGLTTALWFVRLDAQSAPLVIALPAYVILYLSAALWISRALGRRGPLAAPDATRVVFVVVSAVCTLVPWMIEKALRSSTPPALRDWNTREPGQWVLLALAVLAAIATDRMLARRRASGA